MLVFNDNCDQELSDPWSKLTLLIVIIVIYPVDSAIQLFNNRGLVFFSFARFIAINKVKDLVR